MNRRHDRISAMYIDAVLDAGRQHGTIRAARLLHEDGVPLDVALRVLTRPGQRRRWCGRSGRRVPQTRRRTDRLPERQRIRAWVDREDDVDRRR